MFNIIMSMPLILNMAGFSICKGHTWFWIKFSIIDIWQGLEYASSSEYDSVTQSSIKNDRYIHRVLNMLGLEYTRVVNMSRLNRVLCKLYFKDSRFLEYLDFWTYLSLECIKSL